MEWYPVRMRFDDEVYDDEIQGTSPENALQNAVRNWTTATNIELT